MELAGKVAVITGGGSGIGEATARLFAREGASVMVVGRTQEKLDDTVRKIEQDGGTGVAISADVSAPDEMASLFDQVDGLWNRLDILFAHAGINGVWAPVDEIKPEEWHKTIAINLTGTFLTVKYAVPLLKKQGGSIIITSSINGTRRFTGAGASAYSASKAGQIAFMQMTALELAKYRIRVNAICPGAITTEIEQTTDRRNVERAAEPVQYPAGDIPLTDGEPGSAEQVAELVLFLASNRSSHITGTPVWIDGAESLLQG
jgi:NAD(P)-dependent dehydrogenase (short-subunit alcohol dehydrogenase family)